MRILKYLLKKLFILSALMLTSIYLLIATNSGLQVSVYLVQKYLPGQLSIQSISGRLDRNIQLKNLDYAYKGNLFHINQLSLKWNGYKLFNKQIDIDDLQIDGVIINTNQTHKTEKTSIDTKAYIKILKQFNINNLSIYNVVLLKNVNNLKTNQVKFASLKDKSYFQIVQATINNNHTDAGTIYNVRFLGNLNEYLINGSVNTLLKEKKVIINHAQLSIGQSIFSIVGSLKNKWNMQWKLHVPEMHTLLTDYKGLVDANGEITGQRDDPAVKINLSGENVVLGAIKLSKVHALIHGKQEKNKFVATLSAGKFNLPQVGVNVDKVAINANYDLQKTLQLSGEFSTPTGVAHFTGKISDAATPVQFQVNGENIQLLNLPEYKVIGNPQLSISYRAPILDFSGQVYVAKADITPKNYNNVVNLPSEVVFVNQSKKQPVNDDPLVMTMDVNVSLNGKEVYVAYENLKSHLAGQLQVKQNQDEIYTGVGELEMLKGKYQAYGKKLNIRKGKLIYTGNLLTNPGLDIQAVKKVKVVKASQVSSEFNNDKNLNSTIYSGYDSVTVGVSVKGSLDKPIIKLFSEPGLPQDDILSYLYFGYPRSQITGASSLALLNSLTASNGANGVNSIKKGIKNVLGLNQLSIGNMNYYSPETNQTGNTTTVNVGKQIGKKLSINYSIGILNPISVFSVKYQFNKHFSFQSQASSLDTGADIFYEIERD